MSIEENKELLSRWVEVWNAGHLDAVNEFLAPDYVRHDPNGPEIRGAEMGQQLIAMYRAALPDLHLTIEDLVAEGDTAAVRLTARGTQQGELLGIPPTGNQVTVMAMELFRFAHGKIAEQWVTMDALGLLQQLGAIPGPEQGGE